MTALTRCGVDDGEGDYSELPDGQRSSTADFTHAVMAAEKTALHEFDDAKFFEGACRSR